jgi:thioesterase domain-containing protein/acyl carrier protein
LAGAFALDRVARDHGVGFCVHFSSLLGHFGALGTGAYAAANAALDAIAHAQNGRGLRSRSVLWSLWVDVGMGQGVSRETVAVRGFQILTPERGLALLERAMQSDQPQVFTGLDIGNRVLRPHFDPSEIAADAAGDSYVEPRTESEIKLCKIWQELLGAPRVGLKDNFFELGGRSLIAARLFARIEKEFGAKLPLATLFKAPTVEALLKLMTTTGEPARCRAVPLQPKGSRPPLFCIPGGGSDVIVFQDIARELGDDQPLYGLQARGLDATPVEGAFPSVEEVAADFIQAIKEVQPRGPYFISGHCFGCLLAWEVASQLKAQGEEIGSLALLDPIVSNVFSGEIIGRDRLRYHFQKFMRLSLAEKFGYFWEKVRNFSRTLLVRQRISQSYEQARSMHSRYQLKPYPGEVVVFMAEDSFLKLAPATDPRRYYERLAAGGTRYLDVPGDHHQILHEIGAARLAAGLREHLSQNSVG